MFSYTYVCLFVFVALYSLPASNVSAVQVTQVWLRLQTYSCPPYINIILISFIIIVFIVLHCWKIISIMWMTVTIGRFSIAANQDRIAEKQ